MTRASDFKRSSNKQSKPRVLYWFRTDLRLHDSPALQAAVDLEPECLYPVWCWDPQYVYRARVGVNRWQFLIDCQNDVSKSITRINSKSKLHVVREAPQTVLPKLWKAWNITHLVFEKDTDAYARDRDDKVKEMAKMAGVEVVEKMGRTLYDPDDLVKENKGPTMTIAQVEKAGKKLSIAEPIPAPTCIPDPGDTSLEDVEPEQPSPTPDFNASHRTSSDQSYHQLAGPNGDFSPPSLKELGLPAATTPHRGGETLALASLEKILSNKHYTATFQKPQTAPTAFDPQSTTLLSPHLHFGSLSVRQFYHGIQKVLDTYKGQSSKPPTSLIGQLLFRDMYFGAQASLGYTFSQAHLNRTVRFIPWHLPSSINPSTGLVTGSYIADNPQAEEHFRRWKAGLTGFPFIDALMRQLRTEGWIHHLGRHMVACFLTRGGCYIHWERGAEVFEEWLIDHETACNAGNWQWLSCTAFFAQFYRVYSPVAFGRKWDKSGEFVKRYVPELAKYSEKYIYEPWKAPIADQKAWGCRVEGDGKEHVVDGENATYPKPMLDFGEARERCLQGMKKAYEVGMYGDDKRVVDGSWKSAFDDEGTGATEGKKGGTGGMVDGEEEDVDDGEKEWVALDALGHEGMHDNEDEHKDEDNGKGKGHKRVKSDGQATPGKASNGASKAQSEHKRGRSSGQGTLDGMVKRSKR